MRSRCCSTCPETSCTGTTRSRTWPAAWHGALAGTAHVVANADDPGVVMAALAAPPADLGGGRRPLDPGHPRVPPLRA